MNLTDDQYIGLMKLEKWYQQNMHQVIEIEGVVGTGPIQLIQTFLSHSQIELKEVIWLSYDQKQVLELAYRRYHAYYINGVVYKYTRFVDFNSLPVLNYTSNKIEYKWKKEVRKKIDPKYRLIVIFDSLLLNKETLTDVMGFGLPIILIKDPMLLPALDSYTMIRDSNIILNDLHPDLIRNPITYFANKVLHSDKIEYGNYDKVSIIPSKDMNLYNIRVSNMNIALTNDLRMNINQIYREKVLKLKTPVNIPGERLIIMENMYAHKLINKDEKKIKIYLTKGTVGNIVKCNKHVASTKYVPFEFRPDFYHESFDDLVMDRHYLNGMNFESKQIIPDECVKVEYAYALTPDLARLSHWDKLTLVVDKNNIEDEELQMRLLYTAITRARESLTMII